MNKILLLSIILGLTFNLFSQSNAPQIKTELVNYAVHRHSDRAIDMGNISVSTLPGPRTSNISENEIGVTQYDLQTNSATDHRIHLFSDGKIGAAWTQGSATGGFANRGTGYNFNNGSSWGSIPTARLESIRTGWPSYAPLNNGEIVISHNFPTNLVMMKRDVKGTGTWTQTNIPNPAGAKLSWPRICTNGNTIHVLANSYQEYNGMEMALIYLRSLDGGLTWEDFHISHIDLDNGGFHMINGDIYAWANPKNGTIAFVVGSSWSDVVLLKSTDNGDTWTKTTVFEHPSPFPMNQIPPQTSDTIYVCDGAVTVDLDKFGNAHVAFGVLRVLYDDVTQEGYAFFPVSGYVAYWNESYPTLTSLEPEEIWDAGLYVGAVLDLDNSGAILDNLTSADEIATYYLGLASMPNIMVDENNRILLVYTAINELEYGGSMSYSQFFRNIYLTNSYDGVNWGGIYFLTDPQQDVMYEGMECVFPALAKESDGYYHLMFQRDDEPGLHIRGDEDPVTVNDIVYMRISKDLIWSGIVKPETTIISEHVKVYPNPATNLVNTSIFVNENTNLNLNITNVLGQIVYSNNYYLLKGNNIVSIDVSSFSKGIYVINANSDINTNSVLLKVE